MVTCAIRRGGGCVEGRTLSLLGNLADLGLGDIFQIVSLSRRSGTLQLTTPWWLSTVRA